MLHTLCPICKKLLAKDQNSAVCPSGHTFDFAKEGYLYLLTPDAKHSKEPGDNKEMILARKNFLDGDYYAPLANAIADIISKYYNETSVTLIDAGIGTGYYLKQIISSRTHAHINNEDIYLGADISKHALKYASKTNKSAECCVASVYNLPYADGCADVITCIFSPYAMDEYARLLKENGILILASPCENHLIELRRALYDTVRELETPLNTDGFDIISQVELKYGFTLTSSDSISALLTMTPYVYRAPKDKISTLQNVQTLSLTADFKITVLKKAHC